MRTHLLRPIYPPVEVESDTGFACNDERYVTASHQEKPPPALSAVSAAVVTDLSDDYVLGGYAGI